MADKQVSLRAEGVEHASKLDSNVASADNGNLLGLRRNAKEAVRVDAELSTGMAGGAFGLPPTARTIFLALMRTLEPSSRVTSTWFLETRRLVLWRHSTLSLLRLRS